MRINDYMRRIEHKLNRRYPLIQAALEAGQLTLTPRQQRQLEEQLNRLDVDIGSEINQARRRGTREAWSGKLR